MKLEITAQFETNPKKEDRMTGIKLTTKYPQSITKKTTSIVIPIAVCIPLVNALHSMELQPIKPWMEDHQYIDLQTFNSNSSHAHTPSKNWYSWPCGPNKWAQGHLITTLKVEYSKGQTDRLVEVQTQYGDVITEMPHGKVGVIPWILLPITSLRMKEILQNWGYYSEHDLQVMDQIKKEM